MTDGDTPKSKDQCYAELRKAAQTEYENGCDLPTVTLKVDFVNCADTEEYRQYSVDKCVTADMRRSRWAFLQSKLGETLRSTALLYSHCFQVAPDAVSLFW